MKTINFPYTLSRLSRAISGTLIGCSIALALPAVAQQEATGEEGETKKKIEHEVILVTANRVASVESETPIALTVVGEQKIVEQGITDPTKLGDFAPNLQMVSWGGGVQVNLRGITNSDFTERGDPAAGFLIDDVYIARPNGLDVSFYDINRIEVLRGPQGTLFGRNTTAGAVNVITNRPVFDTEGSANIGIGNYGTLQGTLIYNTEVTDDFAIRAGFNYDTRDNYLEEGPNVTADLSPFKENMSFRLQGLKTWDTGELLVRAEYSDIGGNYVEYVPSNHFYEAYPAAGEDAVQNNWDTDEILSVNYPVNWDIERDNSVVSLNAELRQQLGEWDLTYIAAYRKLDRAEDEPRPDDDGDRVFRISWVGETEQQSHELRFSTNQGPLLFQAGAYYLSEDISNNLKLTLTPNTDGNNPPGTTIWWNADPLENDSWALFSQGTYELTDTLRATAGIRYTQDDKERTGAFQVFCSEFDCINETGPRSAYEASSSFSKTTWRLGLDYDFAERNMLYATVATGYKAGGFIDGCEVGTQANCGFTADALYYDPEEIISYEVGAKGFLLDNDLKYSIAAFYYEYDDMQMSAIQNDCLGPGTTSCTITTNAASSSAHGIEFESSTLLTENSSLELNATYIDAQFDDYSSPNRDFSGKELSFSPKFTATVGYTHFFDLSDGGIIEAAVRSKYSDDYVLVDVGGGSLFPQDSHSRTNLSLTYRAPSQDWFVRAFVDNVEDEVQVTNVIFGPTRRAASFKPPRTFGVRAGYSF